MNLTQITSLWPPFGGSTIIVQAEVPAHYHELIGPSAQLYVLIGGSTAFYELTGPSESLYILRGRE